ncbi:carboxymuconolactone decarboxylase family protein [Brevibacillus fulvus]|uniref:4-carboxymuconolactone decarboxylase n=1 Tax=Brevibacillus fulvus TaxID=1125967 RepID=A0A939BTL4_9BACL|nr:carboxymuconolactone decarboxylase family protein [Brevibacillus fulvus]MBM7591633.1 4-carboxymuconolactone decarboxylase [Brevibacillus fulvus]
MAHRKIASKAQAAFGEFAPTFAEYTDNVLFGDVWRREQLSLRERSMLTIAALVSGGHYEQLPYHLRLGRENGITEPELIEAITHLAFYTGWPSAATALQVAKDVFSENRC